jgi:alkylation response protein AidB-like acyl-CoA dehydrogenase
MPLCDTHSLLFLLFLVVAPSNANFLTLSSALRYSRLLLDASVRYAHQRQTFGKPLWSSQIIRAKVAEMAKRIEANWAWTEALAFSIDCGASALAVGIVLFVLFFVSSLSGDRFARALLCEPLQWVSFCSCSSL